MDINAQCRKLLEALYKIAQEHGLSYLGIGPDEVSKILETGIKDTYLPVEFLEEEGYVAVTHFAGVRYGAVRLTSAGMRLVMQPSEFNRQFQPVIVQPISVHGNNNVVGSGNNIDGSFNIKQLSEGTNVQPELLQEISNNLTQVVEALKHKDDKPLKKFLGELTLKGGVEATLVGVKALLATHGVPL